MTTVGGHVSSYKSLLSNNALLAFQYLVNGISPLLLTPLIIRAVGITSFGEIAVGLSWAGYAGLLCQYAFHLTGPKQVSQISGDSGPGLILVDTVGARLLLLALVSVPGLFAIMLLGRSQSVFESCLFLLFPVGSALNAGWFLQAIGRFKLYSLVSASSTVIALVIGVFLLRSAGSNGRILSTLIMVLPNFLSGLFSLVATVTLFRGRMPGFRVSGVVRQLRDGFFIFLSQMFASLYGSLGPIIVGAVRGAASAGTYSAIERLSSAMIGGCLLIHTAAFPSLASLYVSNHHKYWRMMGFVLSIYLSMSIALSSLTMFFSPWILRYFFSRDSQDNQVLLNYALPMVPLSIFGTALTGFYIVSGKQEKVLPLTIAISLITIGLGYFGTKSLGGAGWFGALVIGQIIVGVVALLEARKDVRLSRIS